MAKISPFLILIFLLMSCADQTVEKKKIIFFGDSITEAGVKPNGYIDVIQQKMDSAQLNQDFDLVGKGISGNKVYDLYLRLEKDVLNLKPTKVLIWVGVNDVWHKSLLGTGTDADKFVQFYEAMVEKLKAQNIEVYLCTPAVVGELKEKQNELDAGLDQFSILIRGIAEKYQLTLIDLRDLTTNYIQQNNPNNLKEGILTYDGVHLNDLGNQLIGQWIFEKIF